MHGNKAAAYDARILKLRLPEQDLLKNDAERCSADPVGLASIGRAVGQQVRIKRRDDLRFVAVYTVYQPNPDDPSLLLDLGVVLREAGNLSESESVLIQAQQANPRDSRASYHLGLTLQEAGKAADARIAFTRFLELAPSRYDRQRADVQQRLLALGP